MKRITFILMAIIAPTIPAQAEERNLNLSVPGMTCASCPFIVRSAIEDIDGVISVSTDIIDRTALVIYDNEVTDAETIRAASMNAGYETTVIAADS